MDTHRSLYNFSKAIALLCLLLLPAQASSETLESTSSTGDIRRDSIVIPYRKSIARDSAAIANARYQRKLMNYGKFWNELIPSEVLLHYAGDIGFVSAGFGWHYGHEDRTWQTDILFGYLPKYETRHAKVTMTLKQTYVPFREHVSGDVSIEPLACGLFFNTVFSDQFWVREPDKYPKRYYGFSTKVRANIFLGQRWRYEIPANKRKSGKAITLYYEASTSDLYVASYATNKKVSIWDILVFGVGVKYDFF